MNEKDNGIGKTEGKRSGIEEGGNAHRVKYESGCQPYLTEGEEDVYGLQQDQQWASNVGKSSAGEIFCGWRCGLAGSFLSALARIGCVDKTEPLLRTVCISPKEGENSSSIVMAPWRGWWTPRATIRSVSSQNQCFEKASLWRNSKTV